MVESMVTGLVTGVASVLPAAILALVHKPNWAVLASVIIACVALGVGAHGFLYGRRNARRVAKLKSRAAIGPSQRSGGTVTKSAQGSESELAAAVFSVLWNRSDPDRPMDPLQLAGRLRERFSGKLSDCGPEDILRDVERVRRLGELPPLVRNRQGFFLDSDDLHFKQNLAVEHKRQIAVAAAAYVRPGMSIAVDGGSTTLEVARVLASRIAAKTLFQLRVTTSSLQICSEMLGMLECREAIRAGDLSVWAMAGPLHPSCWTMDPPSTEQCPWPLDLAILGANGVLPDGFYLPNENGLWVKKTFLRLAPATVVVADSTKLGKRLSVRFATWTAPVKLITDRPDDANARRILQSCPKRSVIYSDDI
ncbi:MAG TPA: hypothetical protein VF069_19785 [Streptosporangiaceae bacterium]